MPHAVISGIVAKIDHERRIVALASGEELWVRDGPLDWLAEGMAVTVLYELDAARVRRICAVSTTGGTTAPAGATRPESRRYLGVLQRARAGAYEALKACLGPWDHVLVVWDRRAAERRKGLARRADERRLRERRSALPPTWTTRGFFLVPRSDPRTDAETSPSDPPAPRAPGE
jgi:hypothetical protein